MRHQHRVVCGFRNQCVELQIQFNVFAEVPGGHGGFVAHQVALQAAQLLPGGMHRRKSRGQALQHLSVVPWESGP